MIDEAFARLPKPKRPDKEAEPPVEIPDVGESPERVAAPEVQAKKGTKR